MEINFLK